MSVLEPELENPSQIHKSKIIGKLSLQRIINYLKFIKENDTYPRVLKVLFDATKVEFSFSIQDLDKITCENCEALDKYHLIMHAIILDNPKNTAIAMLYQEISKNSKYRFNIFSTEKRAIEWLNNF